MTPSDFLAHMTPAAHKRFGSDRQWAAACGLPAETLSRLRKRESCDLRTLNALAAAAGFELGVAPVTAKNDSDFGREREEVLLALCASGSVDAATWRAHGDGFFMAGLAMLLASVPGFDRHRYMTLAESLHPGMSYAEVFELWLQRSPLRPSRFLPMLERWGRRAA